MEYTINERQPRALWNQRCHLNTWDYWKRFNYKVLAIDCGELAHFVNLNHSGKIIDPTWGIGIKAYEGKIKPMYFVDFNKIKPNEALNKLKIDIIKLLPWQKRIKMWFGYLKI